MKIKYLLFAIFFLTGLGVVRLASAINTNITGQYVCEVTYDASASKIKFKTSSSEDCTAVSTSPEKDYHYIYQNDSSDLNYYHTTEEVMVLWQMLIQAQANSMKVDMYQYEGAFGGIGKAGIITIMFKR